MSLHEDGEQSDDQPELQRLAVLIGVPFLQSVDLTQFVRLQLL
jgi:hypothetical protein